MRHRFGMRRAIALLLLTVISFPLIGAVLPSDPASNLPPCCRRNGKHHCAMQNAMNRLAVPGAPAIAAVQPKCPLFPKAGPVTPAGYGVLLPCNAIRSGRLPRSGAAVRKADASFARIDATGPVRKRGPPATFE